VSEDQREVTIIPASPRLSQGLGYLEKNTNRFPPSWWVELWKAKQLACPEIAELGGTTYYNPNVKPDPSLKTNKAFRSLGYDTILPMKRGPKPTKERRWFGGRALNEDQARKEGKVWSKGLDYYTQQPVEH
jgi:hypothetical protein